MVALLAWTTGFLVGTTTHIVDLVVGGADVYAGFPPGVRLFWVSLTLLDPLTVVLLWLRRRAGVVVGCLVMAADVSVNWTVAAVTGELTLFGLVTQSAFAVVVFGTAPLLWRAFAGSRTSPMPA
ncbi:hypothetical protein [Agromyces sp. Soil535]|uniref:hypothetical protein n=1 Tax=Agromyces sp. Soil535 TaxID=1736390 RepID=UPI000A656BA6|nr:hypothetical protein [Agromyces sp. Soil535]